MRLQENTDPDSDTESINFENAYEIDIDPVWNGLNP
jgi:hypothetical protein